MPKVPEKSKILRNKKISIFVLLSDTRKPDYAFIDRVWLPFKPVQNTFLKILCTFLLDFLVLLWQRKICKDFPMLLLYHVFYTTYMKEIILVSIHTSSFTSFVELISYFLFWISPVLKSWIKHIFCYSSFFVNFLWFLFLHTTELNLFMLILF